MREKSGSGISRALWIAVLSGGVGAAIPAEGRAAVVINEIHYNPRAPDGKTLEFIELFNASGRTVSLGGWQFTNGVEYVFPAAAALPAGGFAVVCRDRDAFIDRFGAGELLFGNYVGALDNDGEEVVLADAFGAVIDAVRYDDSTPWPSFADGNGASLQRLCADAGSHRWDNWVGAPIDAPTPLRPSSRAVCPLPPLPPPRITFSEVHYHPPDDLDEFEEFIELHNPGPEPVDLAGWRFSDGVAFTFLGDASILPGGYLVVARNQEHMRRSFAIVNVVGDFTGELSNSGERINLVDETNALVDTVFYRDAGEWPYAADGLDRSLEKIDFSRSSDDPANWTHSILPSGEFRHVAGEGPISSLTQQRIVIGIDGVGEYIVDNVRLERVDDPGVNLLPNGDFESGLGDWLPRGNTVESRVEDAIGVGGGGVRGGRGLRVISSAGCTPCGSVDSVSYTWLRGELDNSVEYRLSFDFLRVSGSTDLFVRMLRGVESPVARAMVGPGRAPTHGLERTPPHLSHRGRFPEEPEAGDPVTLTMRVRWIDGEPPPTVTLTYFRADVELREEVSLVMFDDGAHRDGLPGDGTFGATLPGLPHNAQVHYIVTAEASGGGPSRVSPLAVEAESRLPSEFWGYYVYSDPPDSVLPVYHLLIPGVDPSNPEAVNRALNCNTLRPAGFAVRGELYPAVGLRFRGNTACVLKKRNLKVRFNRGHEFLGLRKMNLQGLWTDKGLVREHLAWQFMGEVGAPYCETWYTRLHINGAYHGLFLYLEHPDERFLRRNDLDDDGCLYKARQPPRNGGTPIGVARQSNLDRYEGFWERETCEERDLSELAEFVGALHADAVRPGPTAEFHLERTFPDMLIPYQIGQVVLHNIDSFAKNHFLYQSSGDKRWGLITWDMDLVFGKFFDPDSVGPGRPVGTLNDCMLSPRLELNPWFTSTVNGNVLLHHFVDKTLQAGDGYFQRAYLIRLWNVIQEKYRVDTYRERLDELGTFLEVEAADDLRRWGRSPSNPGCALPDQMLPNLDVIDRQILLHRNFLVRYLETWHSGVVLDQPKMTVTELMYDPEGAGSRLEFIELLNTSGRPIDVSGWSIVGGIDFVFPRQQTVVDTDEVIVVVKDVARFAARYPDVFRNTQVFGPYDRALSNSGEVLRIRDAGPGHPATVDFLDYESGGLWPEVPDGVSIELAAPAPDLDNDRPAAWRLSRVGGTPGRVPTDFVRGDLDGDEVLRLTDAVFLLNHLFLGGPEPACEDAADVDDNGRLNLNDPIYLLNHLFLGGRPIPPPFPERGTDPTLDTLVCSR